MGKGASLHIFIRKSEGTTFESKINIYLHYNYAYWPQRIKNKKPACYRKQ